MPGPTRRHRRWLSDERFRAALFSERSLEGKRNIDAIEISPGRVAAGRVIAHRPAARQPLDAVRDEVRAAVILEEAGRRAVAEARRGPEKLSSTIRSLASSDHRRRRPVSTISRRLM